MDNAFAEAGVEGDLPMPDNNGGVYVVETRGNDDDDEPVQLAEYDAVQTIEPALSETEHKVKDSTTEGIDSYDGDDSEDFNGYILAGQYGQFSNNLRSLRVLIDMARRSRRKLLMFPPSTCTDSVLWDDKPLQITWLQVCKLIIPVKVITPTSP